MYHAILYHVFSSHLQHGTDKFHWNDGTKTVGERVVTETAYKSYTANVPIQKHRCNNTQFLVFFLFFDLFNLTSRSYF